jgi:plastocyanin
VSSTAFPQLAPGTAAGSGTDELPAGQLCSVLGITDVNSAQDATSWRTHSSLVTNSQGEMQIMKKKLFLSGLVVALPLALAAILILRPTQAKSEDTKASPMEVNVDNFTFGPDTLTVPANSKVTWVNKDDAPHVITSNDGLFKSRALDTDDTYSYTFTKAGTYSYYCSIHPKMVGKVVVQ